MPTLVSCQTQKVRVVLLSHFEFLFAQRSLLVQRFVFWESISVSTNSAAGIQAVDLCFLKKLHPCVEIDESRCISLGRELENDDIV